MKLKHVAIIMDGNGRWANQRGLPRIEGHKEGIKRVNEIIDAAIEYGLTAITFYTFSMENWQRPRREVNALMSLLQRYLNSEMQRLIDKGIMFRAIGDTKLLPDGVQRLLKRFEERSRDNRGLIVISALSYGGRDEIINAVRRIITDGINPEEVDKRLFEKYLYTSGIPEPDLIIRTSGEMRLSNFLLWQSAYSEFYFTKTLWPDFGRDEFFYALRICSKRERRFGALPQKR